MEGSHNYHRDLDEVLGVKEKADWFRLEKEHVDYFIGKGCSEKRIKCKKGSLVLWDSRTIHTGSEPIKGRKAPNFRCCVYVCYKERKLASKVTMKKRIERFEAKRLSSHNPLKGKVFPRNPRTYGGPVPVLNELPVPVLSDLGKKLVGY